MTKIGIKNTAKSKIEEFGLDKDFFFVKIINQSSLTDTISKALDRRFVQFYFCTQGVATFHYNQGSYQQILQENELMVLFNPTIRLPMHLSLNKESKLFVLAISIGQLHKVLSADVLNGDFLQMSMNEKYYQKMRLPNSLLLILNMLEEKSNQHAFANLFYKAKVYELLASFFMHQNTTDNCPYLNNSENLEKLKQVKTLLKSSYQSPPTIAELAKDVNLSEYKLKEGFKTVYGQTVFAYLLDYKLGLGKEMMQKKQYKVKEIAERLGYVHSSHFIAAFKKKYGFTPKQYQMSL